MGELTIKIEVLFSNVVSMERVKEWVQLTNEIQQEHSCNCTLFVKAD